ncbi:MAG: fibronectin type III domain-containing protein [Anaerobutyricum sp.]|nr:fibronectin type III domain-containing protein [Anaerobutyricum sp.]
MNYVKCIDKSKLWIALAVMAVALFICGYHVEAEENTGEGNTSIEQPSTKDFGNSELFEFSQPEDHMYTGVEICPEITVKEIVSNQTSGSGETEGSTNSSSEADPKEGENEGTQPKTKTLKLNEDYTVTYSNNTNAGTAEILIQPKDTTKYSGEKKLTFTIKPVDINNLELKISEKTYKGIAQRPDVSLYFNGKRLTRSKDYHVGHYKNNMDVGTATCLVKGDGNFTGSRTAEFKINPKNIYGLSFSDISIRTYNGVAITPKVTIVDQAISPAKTLTQNKEYTLSYIDNNKVGTAGVIISGMGNYSGSKIITFKIRPKATTLVKLTKGKKKIKVKWTKQTTQVTGYQIQYSTSSKFTGAKSVTVKKTYSTKTLTKLKGKKKYYVRVRTYKSVAGIKYYSKWSNVKAITTKK